MYLLSYTEAILLPRNTLCQVRMLDISPDRFMQLNGIFKYFFAINVLFRLLRKLLIIYLQTYIFTLPTKHQFPPYRIYFARNCLDGVDFDDQVTQLCSFLAVSNCKSCVLVYF